MKNTQKGFIIPLVMIVLILAIGGGSYVYLKKDKTPKDFTPTVTPIEDVVTNESVSNNSNPNNINTDKKAETKEVKPVNEKASGMIKSVYSKDGKSYINIDYVEFNPDWEPGGMSSGPVYTNVNSKIRTFEIHKDAKLLIRASCVDKNKCTGEENESVTFNQFSKIFNEKGYIINNAIYLKGNPWDIEVVDGVIIKITEHFVS